jgi:hypothetical protein
MHAIIRKRRVRLCAECDKPDVRQTRKGTDGVWRGDDCPTCPPVPFKGIRLGDSVTYVAKDGSRATGDALMMSPWEQRVFVRAGEYAHTVLVDNSNYVGHTAQEMRK